jgi:hypothetical protein
VSGRRCHTNEDTNQRLIIPLEDGDICIVQDIIHDYARESIHISTSRGWIRTNVNSNEIIIITARRRGGENIPREDVYI